ncbi:MAG: glycosyltransferase [Planctomycetes bacterium]|nr:glycosyltransferase [Planctomycetota bacterium]
MRIETFSPLRAPLLHPQFIRAIIPTFQDWDDAMITVESLINTDPRPNEIVLVNDNQEFDVPSWISRSPVYLVNYNGNRGPAFARNAGACFSTGRRIDWFYFTDTGCAHDRCFFGELIDAGNSDQQSKVAIAGPVIGVSVSSKTTPINHYMTEEAILFPPMDENGPQAIITANAAVSASAFFATGGFDVSFKLAAGEDLFLGVKLRRLGRIHWAEAMVVRHRFKECIDDFRRRFVRYGAGNAQLERRLHLPSMRIERITARCASMQMFADEQVAAMQLGYDKNIKKFPKNACPFGSS